MVKRLHSIVWAHHHAGPAADTLIGGIFHLAACRIAAHGAGEAGVYAPWLVAVAALNGKGAGPLPLNPDAADRPGAISVESLYDVPGPRVLHAAVYGAEPAPHAHIRINVYFRHLLSSPSNMRQ